MWHPVVPPRESIHDLRLPKWLVKPSLLLSTQRLSYERLPRSGRQTISKAKSIITANVQVEPSRIILKAKSASEAWEILRLKYEGKGLFLRMQYHSEFNSLRLADCESLLDYQIQLRNLSKTLTKSVYQNPQRISACN
jgi:hypothetical protein